ncbi:hypothetical protein [Paenibacillus aquistagni]|uniref:Uncharacterized protein n=1 Tax=Paenibacillus aquistagni TaxID=1852522 RepID=A0A1X7KQU3_9BACL|nr:hypothetical protein [Paenibacillus aquistagni]SMG43658.1 hypothetical protein SAMN06295960_2589 [Paenibacillus aquistagni]
MTLYTQEDWEQYIRGHVSDEQRLMMEDQLNQSDEAMTLYLLAMELASSELPLLHEERAEAVTKAVLKELYSNAAWDGACGAATVRHEVTGAPLTEERQHQLEQHAPYGTEGMPQSDWQTQASDHGSHDEAYEPHQPEQGVNRAASDQEVPASRKHRRHWLEHPLFHYTVAAAITLLFMASGVFEALLREPRTLIEQPSGSITNAVLDTFANWFGTKP